MNVTLTLPEGATSKVNSGDTVKFDDMLYSFYNENTVTLNISDQLKIKPEGIFHYLNKIIGESIQKGELIAQKKGALFTQKVISEYTGVLKEIDHRLGTITLNVVSDDEKDIRADIEGEVEKVEGNKIALKVKGGTSIPLKEVNKDGMGDVFIFPEEAYFSATEDEIDNKIIVMKELKTHILAKCEALGCNGFIALTGTNSSNLPCAFLNKETDYATLQKHSNSHIIFTVEDKAIILYD